MIPKFTQLRNLLQNKQLRRDINDVLDFCDGHAYITNCPKCLCQRKVTCMPYNSHKSSLIMNFIGVPEDYKFDFTVQPFFQYFDIGSKKCFFQPYKIKSALFKNRQNGSFYSSCLERIEENQEKWIKYDFNGISYIGNLNDCSQDELILLFLDQDKTQNNQGGEAMNNQGVGNNNNCFRGSMEGGIDDYSGIPGMPMTGPNIAGNVGGCPMNQGVAVGGPGMANNINNNQNNGFGMNQERLMNNQYYGINNNNNFQNYGMQMNDQPNNFRNGQPQAFDQGGQVAMMCQGGPNQNNNMGMGFVQNNYNNFGQQNQLQQNSDGGNPGMNSGNFSGQNFTNNYGNV